MKSRGRKPTREERKLLVKVKLDTYVWLVKKHMPNEMHIINKITGEEKILNI